ncbi:hypothetical protein BD779DRAFT_1677315 [Infundibulicybe gibba]|nr:hypothetical protein BD779DRAFT_1677315 [Infundibulicybe gibba]
MPPEIHVTIPEDARIEQLQSVGPPTTPNDLLSQAKSVTADAVSPALLENIRNCETRNIETVLSACLELRLPETRRGTDLETSCKDVWRPCFQYATERVQTGRNISSDERSACVPFISAFNWALKDLEAVGWDELSHTTARDPPKCHFSWDGVLSSQEFSLTGSRMSTLRDRYEMGDSPLCINPQTITNSVDKPADIGDLKEAVSRSSGWASSEAEGGGLGKRKREVESQVGGHKRFRECTRVSRRTPAIRSASHAAERMSRAFWVTHVINLVIIDDVAYVWYYDDRNTVQSFGINFLHDLPYFLVLLLAFQRFSLRTGE